MTMTTTPKATFADVLDLLDSLEIDDRGSVIRTNLDDKFEMLKRKNPNSFAVTNWRTFKQLPIKTASCIFSTLNSTVDDYAPELVVNFDETPTTNFAVYNESVVRVEETAGGCSPWGH